MISLLRFIRDYSKLFGSPKVTETIKHIVKSVYVIDVEYIRISMSV